MRDFDFLKKEFLKKHEHINDSNYLEKYINYLINYNSILTTDEYTEKHHILPRCNFPEFSDESWNIVELKYQDHKLVHLWLFKSINIRSYQKPLNWMMNQYKNSQEISNAAKNGWKKLKNDEEKYKVWKKNRSKYMSSLPREEQIRRSKIFWDNITENEYSAFCNNMKKYWTKEKKLEKSEEMKIFYSNIENIIKKSDEQKIVWQSRDNEFKENFRKKMDIINKDVEKRKDAGKKIKDLWKSEEYLNKMKKRKLRAGTKIKLIDTDGVESVFDTMRKFEECFKFSTHLIRKYRDTDKLISKEDLNESNIELENCKIETING